MYSSQSFKGFGREKSFGLKRHFSRSNPLKDFQALNGRKINMMIASNMKTCDETKVWVLNLNLASKISYDRVLNNFQNVAVN